MADYLVRNDGTATGDAGRYTSEQTGSFTALGTANFYGSIQLAIAATTTPVSGDRILVSSAHALTGGGITHNLALGVNVEIICVDDLNCENYRPVDGTRATEHASTSGADIIFTTSSTYRGMEFISTDNLSFGANDSINFHDCILQFRDIALISSGDGTTVSFHNCEIIATDANSVFNVNYAATYYFKNCKFTSLTGTWNKLFAQFAIGGGRVTVTDSNLSGVTGILVADAGATVLVDDMLAVSFDRCKLADGVVVHNEVLVGDSKSITISRSGFVAADAESQYLFIMNDNQVEDDSGIRRADGQAFEDSGTQVSYRVQTGADTSTAKPFTFEFPITRWSELTGAADTLRFYVASTTAKDNKKVYFDVSYPDATTKNDITRSTSAKSSSWGGVDTMGTGAVLTTDGASDWRDGVGTFTGNEYLVDVATTNGLDCYPTVVVTITEANADFYIGSEFDLV